MSGYNRFLGEYLKEHLPLNIYWQLLQRSEADSRTIEDYLNENYLQIAFEGAILSTQKILNFIEGSNVTLGITENPLLGRTDVEIAAAGGGPTDHAALSHLAYADAGHTGFQAALSFGDLLGTTNQVSVATGTGRLVGGNATLSLPQNIHSGASPTFSALTLSGLSAGSVLFAGAGGAVSQDNAKLFWDNVNKRLGIGTIAPSRILHSVGDAWQIERSGSAPGVLLMYPTVVADNSIIGTIQGKGWNDASAEKIYAIIDFMLEQDNAGSERSGIQFRMISGATWLVRMYQNYLGHMGIAGGIRIGSVTPAPTADYYAADGTKGYTGTIGGEDSFNVKNGLVV